MSREPETARAMRLREMVEFIFSKNAGPYLTTFDIVFKTPELFGLACASRCFTREAMSRFLGVEPDRVLSLYEYAPGNVIKFTIVRDVPSGAFGDRSVFGSQQWPPLLDFEVTLGRWSDSREMGASP